MPTRRVSAMTCSFIAWAISSWSASPASRPPTSWSPPCDLRDATDEDRIEFRHATRARQAAFNPEIPEYPGRGHAHGRVPLRPVLGGAGRQAAWPATPAPPCARRASASISRTCSTPTGKPASVSASGMRAPRRSSPWWPVGITSDPRAASACAIACTTSSTAFWLPTTACCAWAADAA